MTQSKIGALTTLWQLGTWIFKIRQINTDYFPEYSHALSID